MLALAIHLNGENKFDERSATLLAPHTHARPLDVPIRVIEQSIYSQFHSNRDQQE